MDTPKQQQRSTAGRGTSATGGSLKKSVTRADQKQQQQQQQQLSSSTTARSKRTYGAVLSEWLRKTDESGGDEPLPEEVSNKFSVAEKEAYYVELCEALDRERKLDGDNAPDPTLEDISSEDRQALLQRLSLHLGRATGSSKPTLGPDEALRAQNKPFGETTSITKSAAEEQRPAAAQGPGYDVFDLQALDWLPDEKITELDGSQELLDPLEDLTDEEFELQRIDDAPEAFTFVRKIDDSFREESWLPPTLEPRLASLRQGNQTKSLDEWKNALVGHVSRFMDVSRQTQRRAQLVFFVRRDLYLLLLIDRARPKELDVDLFVQKAHFYAWSWARVQSLFAKKNRQAGKEIV